MTIKERNPAVDLTAETLIKVSERDRDKILASIEATNEPTPAALKAANRYNRIMKRQSAAEIRPKVAELINKVVNENAPTWEALAKREPVIKVEPLTINDAQFDFD
jgi:hypothetical protein